MQSVLQRPLGGAFECAKEDLKAAIGGAEEGEFHPLDPYDPSSGVADRSLFDILAAFRLRDGYEPLKSVVKKLSDAREKLSEEIDLLLTDPLLLLSSSTRIRELLDLYISAYSTLLRLLKEHVADLFGQDNVAYRFAVAGLLKLDVVFVRCNQEWKAILTPLHPFHLWRFREIINATIGSTKEYGPTEKEQLAAALSNLPHLLHFVVYGAEDRSRDLPHVLPLAGVIGTLPTYENHTNRYLGRDGVERLETILRKWVEEAPYSIPQIRIALIDVPDLAFALRKISDFLQSYVDAKVVLDVYFTNPIHEPSSLARLDFDNKDFNLADDLYKKRLTVFVNAADSLEAAIGKIDSKPVHIAFFFDQASYRVAPSPRAQQLIVSPLVVSFEYSYSEQFKRGTISPSSEAQEGIFADFHFLVEQGALLPAGQQFRLLYHGDARLDPLNGILGGESTRWLVLADRDLSAYRPTDGILLSEERSGQREVAVWSKVTSRSVRRITDLLRGYNLNPSKDVVVKLLQRFGHIAAGGLFSFSGASESSRLSREKGLIGTIIAAAWYTRKYPGALVASLDSGLARQWLQMRSGTNERADLVGLRVEGNALFVEPIEVKTRESGAEVTVSKDQATGTVTLSGKAIDQLDSIRRALELVFGLSEGEDIFTAARREVLKYQLYRECFRDVHDSRWQAGWFRILQDAFSLVADRQEVKCGCLVCHVHLEVGLAEETVVDSSRPLRLVRIGTQTVNPIVETTMVESIPDAEPVPSPELVADSYESTARELESPTVGPAETSETLASVNRAGRLDVSEESATSGFIPENRSLAEEARGIAKSFLRACMSYKIAVDECDSSLAKFGPTVTRFYIKLRRGQRFEGLRSVLNDIGREMRRSGLMISPIPNSDLVALDVPLLTKRIVPLSDILSTLEPVASPELLPIPIGVTPEGDHIVEDLGQLPHLLVGGTTGSGKTIFLYGVLTSLIKTHPTAGTLQVFLSTSGREDFSFFEGLPFLDSNRVVFDAREAINLLQSHVTKAFDERADLLALSHCRDIGEYNRKNEQKLAPLVVMVDEFADLVDQLAGDRRLKDAFFDNVRRIAQIGRKRGVHLVLCTQRPSADLVPTSIRTLLNGRLALKVNDATASRMIIDEPGAESLQMHGDLLFSTQSQVRRAQGYYISTEELVSFLKPYRK